MKEFLRNHILKITLAFLLVQPFIDIATSLLVRFSEASLTFGMVIRFAFLALILIYCFFICQTRLKKYFIVYMIVLALYSVAYMALRVTSSGEEALFTAAKTLLKSFYFVLILICFSLIYHEQKKTIDSKYLAIIAACFAGALLIAIISGTDFISYKYGKLGSSGWFYAPNEVGTIIGVLFPFMVCYVAASLNPFRLVKFLASLVVLILYIALSLNIGTKVPMLSVLLTLGGMGVVNVIRIFISRHKKRCLLMALGAFLLLAGTTAVLPVTAAGQNLSTHMASVGMEGVQDFFIVEETTNDQNVPEDQDRQESSDTNINSKNVIYSSRDVYLEQAKENYKATPTIEKLLGAGPGNMVEMDFHDIFFQFGIVGFIIYITPLVFIIVVTLIRVIRKLKLCILDNIIVSMAMGLMLSLFIGLVSGHVFTAPAVSIYPAICLAGLISVLDKNLWDEWHCDKELN